MTYEQRKNNLIEACAKTRGSFRVRKGSSSNLFRYGPRLQQGDSTISLAEFNHVLALDAAAGTVETEGLVTYEKLVAHSLERGFLPTVSPELKHITVAGAIVGIGIESTCFRYGFVHDGLLEADVLLSDGRVVTCTADNEYSDLLFGLPNSYGTLGYILRARIRLIPAQPYVRIENRRYHSIESYLDGLQTATRDQDRDFVEGLFYSASELYATSSYFSPDAPAIKDIYRDHVYYRLLRQDASFYLPTFDYIFRYDPDWFWNVPEGRIYDLLRRYGPMSIRNSGFYARYRLLLNAVERKLGRKQSSGYEPLIQDWQLPWQAAGEFLQFIADEVDIQDRPWVAGPILTPGTPTNYPIEANKPYLNVGCYCSAKKPRADIDYYYTRILDRKCFELGGIKMLYSSSFFDEDEFDRHYNGEAYRALKSKYDSAGRAPTLYQKAVLNR